MPSVNGQGVLCRAAATALRAEVIGEFVDRQQELPWRVGLRQIMELAGHERGLDYLIVSSRDRLSSDYDEAFELAWRLGFARTVVVPADWAYEFPWTWAKEPSRT